MLLQHVRWFGEGDYQLDDGLRNEWKPPSLLAVLCKILAFDGVDGWLRERPSRSFHPMFEKVLRRTFVIR